jgi:hypothetical protein
MDNQYFDKTIEILRCAKVYYSQVTNYENLGNQKQTIEKLKIC